MTNEITASLAQAKEKVWDISKALGDYMISEGYEHVTPQLEVAVRHLNEAYSQLEKAMLKG